MRLANPLRCNRGHRNRPMSAQRKWVMVILLKINPLQLTFDAKQPEAILGIQNMEAVSLLCFFTPSLYLYLSLLSSFPSSQSLGWLGLTPPARGLGLWDLLFKKIKVIIVLGLYKLYSKLNV